MEPLLDENIDAIQIYFLVQNQVIIAPGGQIIDLNINAIKVAMDLYEVQNQRQCLGKVMELFNYFRKESKGMQQ